MDYNQQRRNRPNYPYGYRQNMSNTSRCPDQNPSYSGGRNMPVTSCPPPAPMPRPMPAGPMEGMSRSMPAARMDGMPCHDDSMNRASASMPNPFADYAIAMAYVKWQKWGPVYDACDALSNGTLFPVLNKPFCAWRCNG